MIIDSAIISLLVGVMVIAIGWSLPVAAVVLVFRTQEERV